MLWGLYAGGMLCGGIHRGECCGGLYAEGMLWGVISRGGMYCSSSLEREVLRGGQGSDREKVMWSSFLGIHQLPIATQCLPDSGEWMTCTQYLEVVMFEGATSS